MGNINCPYCKQKAETIIKEIIIEYVCPVCGHYFQYNVDPFFSGTSLPEKYNNKTASYLFYHKDLKNRFVGDKEDFEKVKQRFSQEQFSLITVDEIEAFWPKSFSEKTTNILLWLDSKTNYLGERIEISYNELNSLAFFTTNVDAEKLDDQYKFFIDYYYHIKKYITYYGEENTVLLSLTSEGFERIEELQLDIKNNKKVFVSMSFAPSTTTIREAIRKGITKAEYDAALIDEIIHNKQIVPEMFRLIRESRLLVMDITEPNYGAYYEAGYAQGLGKDVIITCSKAVFNKNYETEEDKKMMKYIKPHFDIAQKQILVWEDEEDLTNKLSEWIKAIE